MDENFKSRCEIRLTIQSESLNAEACLLAECIGDFKTDFTACIFSEVRTLRGLPGRFHFSADLIALKLLTQEHCKFSSGYRIVLLSLK